MPECRHCYREIRRFADALLGGLCEEHWVECWTAGARMEPTRDRGGEDRP